MNRAIIGTAEVVLSVNEFSNLNAKSIFFKDPQGNTLELICRQSMQKTKTIAIEWS